MNRNPLNVLMLSASLSLTGTHRVLMDLLEGLDKNKFRPIIVYKPEFHGSGVDLVPKIREMGFEIHQLRGRHLFSLRGLADLLRIVTSHHVDIVHCWDSLSIIARFIAKISGAKVIDSIGNPPSVESWKNRFAKKVSSLLLDGVVFASHGSREAHHKFGPNILRFCKEQVIYNCIRLNKLPEYGRHKKDLIRKEYGIHSDDFILSNLGMYNEQKAQEFLIQALPMVLERQNNVKLFLIGWGSRQDHLRKQREILNLENHVILTGKKQRQEVFDLLSVTDIYVSSSLWEGLPIALLEAMAFRLPVVATDVIGNCEVVANGNSGLLVPARNSFALAKAILTLIENPGLRKNMGTHGRKRTESLFTPEKFVRAHEAFYESLLDSHGKCVLSASLNR